MKKFLRLLIGYQILIAIQVFYNNPQVCISEWRLFTGMLTVSLVSTWALLVLTRSSNGHLREL